MQVGDGGGAGRLDGVGHGGHGQHAAAVTQGDGALALAFQLVQARFQLGAGHAQLAHQPAVAQLEGHAVQCRADAAAGQGGEFLHVQQCRAGVARGIGHGQRYGVVGTRRQARRDQRGRMAGLVGHVPILDVGLHRLAMRERAGLVQRQPFQVAAFFEVHAALDQDAAARRGGQSADDADRRGNDQGAGAGDDQQRQGAVDGVEPGLVPQQGRQHRHQQRDAHHGGRIDAGKAVDEALRGRPGALGLFDGMDDARQRGVSRRRGDPVLEGACRVHRGRVDRIVLRFFHRQAFARDGGLVHGRAAADDDAVGGDALARTHSDDVTRLQFGGGYFQPLAICLLHGGRFRRQVQQSAHGIACPVEGTGFDQFGHVEQEHHHGRFGPLSDQDGAGDGDAHQGIDVEVAVAHGDPALAVGADAAGQDGGHRQGCGDA